MDIINFTALLFLPVIACIWVGVFFYTVYQLIAFAIDLLRRNRSRQDLGYSDNDRQRILRLARPTLLLTPSRTPGFSKLGGLPELPAGLDWPAGRYQRPAFLAQIDLAQIAEHGGLTELPDSGRLFLFFEEEANGHRDAAQVIYSCEPPGPPRAPSSSPKSAAIYPERRVAFLIDRSLPSFDWFDEDWPDRSRGEDPVLGMGGDIDAGDESQHRIGGYPGEIQNGQLAIEAEYLYRGMTRNYTEPVPDSLRRAARAWRLLFQIDTDPALDMNWWDSGRIYVFARARDMKRGDFSRTVTITQTH